MREVKKLLLTLLPVVDEKNTSLYIYSIEAKMLLCTN